RANLARSSAASPLRAVITSSSCAFRSSTATFRLVMLSSTSRTTGRVPALMLKAPSKKRVQRHRVDTITDLTESHISVLYVQHQFYPLRSSSRIISHIVSRFFSLAKRKTFEKKNL